MTLPILQPQDHALLDDIERKCCNHPDLLAALKRFRADHLAMARLNVELLQEKLEAEEGRLRSVA